MHSPEYAKLIDALKRLAEAVHQNAARQARRRALRAVPQAR